MRKKDKILVLGAAGMVGSAIVRNLSKRGYTNLFGTYYSKQLSELEKYPLQILQADLQNQDSVKNIFQKLQPDHIFLAAAKVGGIHANNTYPATFIYNNLIIQNNIIQASFEYGIKKLMFMGSSCIYPKFAPQPMKEEHLLTGPLEPTNEPYAIAKIAGIKMCESYNREYGTRFMAVMPTNLYGPNDNFDLENSHVLPALIRKFHEAKVSNAPSVTIWGTGSPKREFLHVDEMADASVHIMSLPDSTIDKSMVNYPNPCFANVGSGQECSIKELALIIKNETGYTGELVFDSAKPDGTPRKLLDVGKINDLGWKSKIPIEEGIRKTYQWYKTRYTR